MLNTFLGVLKYVVLFIYNIRYFYYNFRLSCLCAFIKNQTSKIQIEPIEMPVFENLNFHWTHTQY